MNGITIRYTLNQSCIGSIQEFKHDWESGLSATAKTGLRGIIRGLSNIGVHEWTITSPLLMELLREMFPSDFLEVSTIAEVSTPEDVVRWKELGANGANLSTSVNRDFRLLNRVNDTSLVLSILANEACLFRCPWRRECYNLSSHNSQRSEELFDFYPFRRCTEVRLSDPVEWIKARLVLPQWMKVYQKETGINWFKIAYRTHPKEVALPMLRAYMEQDFHGNLLELWPTITHLGKTAEPKDKHNIPVDEIEKYDFLGHFIKDGSSCARLECSKCPYCKGIYMMATGSRL